MFVESYIGTATTIFNAYSLQSPLAEYLKIFFKSNPKLGSRDRKYIAELLYGLYRMGIQHNPLSVRERLLAGSFLSGSLPLLFFEKADPFLAANYDLGFAGKKKLVTDKYGISFHMDYPLSHGITAEEYFEYLFRPSRVFVRIRRDKEKILGTLLQKEIEFKIISDTCISFPLKVKLDELLPDISAYVIQDHSSQMAADFLNPLSEETWWDCCAASGGKSLLLLDKNSKTDLTVSDIRAGIIENLHARFRQYGHKKYKAFVIDVSKNIKQDFSFDKIIADVPCSGSGTWSRSPEQYYFFDEKKLQVYQSQQKAILNNVVTHLKSGGSLYYFTCSIFAAENEDVVNSLDANDYTIVQQKLLKAFQPGGDCLFFCEIQKK